MRPSRPAAARRRGLLIFTAAFAALFAVVALAEGIGHPDVPPGAVAVIEGVSGDAGTITRAEFRRGLERAAAEAGLEEGLKPSDPRIVELRGRVMSILLDWEWLPLQAEDTGISVDAGEVAANIARFKDQNDLAGEPEYRRFLDESHYTPAEKRQEVEVRAFIPEFEAWLEEGGDRPSDEEIEAYYERDKQLRFTNPARREIRMVFNTDRKRVERAKALLEEDNSVSSWRRIVRKYSIDQASRRAGGLTPLTEGSVPEPLSAAIFAAPVGRLEGIVTSPRGHFAFQVVSSTPEDIQPLAEVRGQIVSALVRQSRTETAGDFINDYFTRWRSRTFCAPGYVTERCANFEWNPHLPAFSACYEANPRGGRPEACPAPVSPRAPALPGTVTSLEPRGTSLPQGPRPAGTAPGDEAGAAAGTQLR